MATTSFTKNFSISKQNAEAFTKLMTGPAKPLLPKNYKSSFINLDKNPRFAQKIREAIDND